MKFKIENPHKQLDPRVDSSDKAIEEAYMHLGFNEALESCQQQHDRIMGELFEDIGHIETLNDNYDISIQGHKYFRRSVLTLVKHIKEKYGVGK